MVRKHFSFGYSKTEYDKKELKFANLNFTMQVRHVFQVLRSVISRFYVLFPGSMLNHRPVCLPTYLNDFVVLSMLLSDFNGVCFTGILTFYNNNNKNKFFILRGWHIK